VRQGGATQLRAGKREAWNRQLRYIWYNTLQALAIVVRLPRPQLHRVVVLRGCWLTKRATLR
jgi:hypothetical protein